MRFYFTSGSTELLLGVRFPESETVGNNLVLVHISV